jgi:hypothetical protein
MDEGRLGDPNPLYYLRILYPDRYGREKKVVQLSSDLRRKNRSGMLSRKVVWRNVMEVNIPKKTFSRQPKGKLMKYLTLCPAKKRIKSLWKMHVVDRSAYRQHHYKIYSKGSGIIDGGLALYGSQNYWSVYTGRAGHGFLEEGGDSFVIPQL